MAQLFREVGLSEGEFINSYFRRRLLEKNQNSLGAITGPTGSGKTYASISILCNYYKTILKKPFPTENIVFSPREMIERLRYFEKENLKGEQLLAEEWGINNSALEFQQKTQRMLSYVMQSFRSMNVGVIMTLPVLTMLSKSTRQLLHYHFITNGIDYEEKCVKVKPLFHQLNQSSGKSFWKYPKVYINKRLTKLKRFKITKPDLEISEKYEVMKKRFVGTILEDFIAELKKKDDLESKKLMRPLLTQLQAKHYDDILDGLNDKQRGEKYGTTHQAARAVRLGILKKGYKLEFEKKQKQLVEKPPKLLT